MENSNTMTGYKSFTSNWDALDNGKHIKYEIGKTYSEKESNISFFEYPLGVLSFDDPTFSELITA